MKRTRECIMLIEYPMVSPPRMPKLIPLSYDQLRTFEYKAQVSVATIVLIIRFFFLIVHSSSFSHYFKHLWDFVKISSHCFFSQLYNTSLVVLLTVIVKCNCNEFHIHIGFLIFYLDILWTFCLYNNLILLFRYKMNNQ